MRQTGWRHAFSLIELLVVVAIIAILASLLLPALSSAKTTANAAQCLSNKKQLQLAWWLYATDHEDQIPPNGEVVPGPARADLKYWWAQGIMNYEDNHSDNTNVHLLIDPQYAQLGNYTKAPAVYKCPDDKSSVLISGSSHSRVRSVSMNVHVGRCIDCFGDEPKHVGPRTVAKIPNPTQQFVFIDEHPDSINTIAFWLSPAKDRYAKIINFPGSMHNGAATLSFADGHAEAHRWTDPRTKPPWKRENFLSETESPNNPDIEWLQRRTYFP